MTRLARKTIGSDFCEFHSPQAFGMTRRFKNILPLLVIGFLVGCSQETPKKPENRFVVPPSGYPVSVQASGSERVDALVRQLISQRPHPIGPGTRILRMRWYLEITSLPRW